jgi:hypothetical protein
LLDREVNGYGWKPNNPWLYPTALMDNMPNFQLGILASLRPVGLELRDSVGRLRGSGGTDTDLEAVYTAISYAPDRWLLGSKFPFLGMSSESQYRDAIKGLRGYNARVGTGQAIYERRVDTLVRLLDRLALSACKSPAACSTPKPMMFFIAPRANAMQPICCSRPCATIMPAW